MRPKAAILTILLAALLATAVIGVGTRITSAADPVEIPAMRSL
ncbi:hypothetical protein [Microbaculum marinum]|uniref:Uncharacterized protein n=1 Tax=Microbaculum marinum TaxID=1764581 RepID=A0AAW9S4L3_9HYPH